MASYRRPKGTVVRPIPDWNSQNMFYGGVQNGFAALTSFNAGCINLDTVGRSFIIWDCTITVGRFAAATAPTLTFMNLGIFQGAVPVAGSALNPVDPFQGSPNVFADSNFNTTNLTTLTSSYVPLSGEGTWRWTNPWPMAILRPGFAHILFYQATQALVGYAAVGELAAYP